MQEENNDAPGSEEEEEAVKPANVSYIQNLTRGCSLLLLRFDWH